jgi:hypothetical protein
MGQRRLPLLGRWPVARQVAAGDRTGLDHTATSPRTEAVRARRRSGRVDPREQDHHREPRAWPALAAAQCSDPRETFEPQRRGTF